MLGLNASSNGRSCEQHECCGKAVKADDVIRFKLAVVEDVLGKPLETIKAVLIKDGTELCTVGFLGREVAALPSQRSKYIDKFAQVLKAIHARGGLLPASIHVFEAGWRE